MKGSALKSSTLEPALKDYTSKMIDAIIFKKANYKEIYISFIKEVLDIKDINRWASKKTITERTAASERLNETKVMDAIKNDEIVKGDKVYVYVKDDETLALVKYFNKDYSVDKYLDKVFQCTKRFETILPVKELFLNYALKKNKKALEEIRLQC
jgi:NhaP-type Na+/H+ and K+/H+ antiporter